MGSIGPEHWELFALKLEKKIVEFDFVCTL